MEKWDGFQNNNNNKNIKEVKQLEDNIYQNQTTESSESIIKPLKTGIPRKHGQQFEFNLFNWSQGCISYQEL